MSPDVRREANFDHCLLMNKSRRWAKTSKITFGMTMSELFATPLVRLFLHAQTQLPSFPGRVLLLSPIVGEFTNAEARTSFSPPRPTRLKDLADTGQFSVPHLCEMHFGEEDCLGIPATVQALGLLTGIPAIVVPGSGHDLGKEYVGLLLERWIIL
jgi:hypothetical protein